MSVLFYTTPFQPNNCLHQFIYSMKLKWMIYLLDKVVVVNNDKMISTNCTKLVLVFARSCADTPAQRTDHIDCLYDNIKMILLTSVLSTCTTCHCYQLDYILKSSQGMFYLIFEDWATPAPAKNNGENEGILDLWSTSTYYMTDRPTDQGSSLTCVVCYRQVWGTPGTGQTFSSFCSNKNQSSDLLFLFAAPECWNNKQCQSRWNNAPLIVL